MAASTTGTSTLTKPVNVIFQQTLLRNAKALCPYFAGTVPAEVTQHAGSFTAAWRRIENLTPTTTALTELSGAPTFPTRDNVTPSITNVSAAVSKYGQYLLLNEEADLVNFNGQTDKLMEVLGISAGRSLNMLQRNEVEDNATIVYANGTSDGTVTSKMLVTNIASVINTLSRNNALPFTPLSTGSQNVGTSPILPGFWGACHPDVAYDIAQMTGFKGVETYAGHTQTVAGEFGLIGTAGMSVRFVQTADASIDADSGGAKGSNRSTSGTNGDLYSTPIWGRDCVGSLGFGMEHVKEIYTAGDKLPAVQLITKERGSSGVADPFNELATMAWKSWHAAKILNTTWIRTIRSQALLL
jgi:N4-gp56 family major capsid protein